MWQKPNQNPTKLVLETSSQEIADILILAAI